MVMLSVIFGLIFFITMLVFRRNYKYLKQRVSHEYDYDNKMLDIIKNQYLTNDEKIKAIEEEYNNVPF